MTHITWLKNKILEDNLSSSDLANLYTMFKTEQSSKMSLSSYKRRICEAFEQIAIDELEDVDLSNEDLTEKLVKLSAQKQRIQDTKNYEVKIKRENERLFNLLDAQFSELISLLEKVDLSKVQLPSIKKVKTKKYGVLQLSDIHCNEEILLQETHNLNEYNFDILSKRLRKFILKSIEEFKHENVSDIYIALTGDLVNSSRRLSEKLAQITSLTKASLLLTFLLEQAFLELRKAGFTLHITGIVGNESRIPDDMESTEMTASENWDFLIFNNLRHILKNTKGINFIMPDNQISSLVKLPNGFNFLINHGHSLKGDLNKALSKILQNYVYEGIKINMVLTGHLHSAMIGDFACRSASLCGANSYSNSDLMLISRASQNIYIIDEDKSFKGIKIDLQNTCNIIGYDIISELESYTPTNKIIPNLRIISEVLV